MTASAKTANDSSNLNANDFNMKHRLTGAGLLISLGVVVLPWLLGSYSISVDGDASAQKAATQKIEKNVPEIADNSIQINDDENIKVFVSKIKPVDSKGRQIYQAQKSSAKEATKPNNKANDDKSEAERVKEKLKAELNQKSDTEKNAEPSTQASKKADVKKVAKIDKPSTTKKADTKKEIEQGYIVSVGVYLKKDGAERVINDLKKKGFTPSSSESKSSKGLATRVWLGPFLTRAAAGKERSKLEQVIGEKGWIIRYP